MKDIRPIVQPDMSDSASLDNVLEFFVMSGLSLPHAMAMLVPESFNDKNPISEDLKAFYEYHSILMEPWDGPAALLFSDGRYAGGMLDRNGLRPARYLITHDGMMVVASEAGVISFEAEKIKEKGRLQPGKILMVDTEEGRIYYDGELKEQLAAAKPYRQWLSANRIELDTLKSGRKVANTVDDYDRRLRAFGYTREDVERILMPMCSNGVEPTASMGNDTPLAVLSDQPQLLFNYFRQQFAQVTNPPIDPIREELVMSLTEYIGAVGMNILLPNETHCKMVRLPHPILNNTQLDILCNIRYKGFNTVKLPMLFEAARGKAGLQEAIDHLCKAAEKAVTDGANYIILSDRGIDARQAAIPSLLAISAVHHHLISVQKRVQTALIVESGEIREVMHAALLLGYGASAICPYMAYAVLDDLVKKGEIQMNYETAEKNYIKAVCKGLYKIMSKMGISTIRSYRGAKIFEAVGLSEELLKGYFGTASSTIGGIRLEEIAKDYITFHDSGFAPATTDPLLPYIGQMSYRKDGENHAWNPETISTLQLATRTGSYKKFKEFTRAVDEKQSPIFLRDFFGFRRNPIDIEQVEPVESIVKHFVTGAISFGAISKEAHEALALAMNELGTRSNTGEGGEDNARFHDTVDGISPLQQDEAGSFGTFRRNGRVSGERRGDTDQGGPGCQAGRRRTTARLQGGRGHCPHAPFHSGYIAYLASTSSRYLFHRRLGTAHLRPEECEPARCHQCETGGRKWCRYHRRRCGQGKSRPHRHLGCRGRYGRIAGLVHTLCGNLTGNRSERNTADTGTERPARTGTPADRRPVEDRPRHHQHGPAGCRGICFRHHSPHRTGLRNDAQMSLKHLPRGRSDPRPQAAGPFPRTL